MTMISATALNELMQGAGEWALFDVRETGEADRGHIRGASFLPRRMIEPRLAELVPDPATTVVFYDEGGPRAALAAEAAARAGYRDARTLEGGLRAWKSAGFVPVSGSNVVSKHFGEEISHSERVPQITAQTLHEWQAAGKPHIVCDIRTPGEYTVAHIPGAVGAFGVDAGLNAADLAARQMPIVVHCAGRTRSIIACQTLRELGVGDVHALEDGTMGWTLAGFELEKGHPDRLLQPSPASVRDAGARGRALAERAGVTAVAAGQLREWLAQREAGALNLYLFDVRQVPEYEAAHVPGAKTLPGGLAIQRADEFAAVRNAPIVLVDDDGARAWITGYWLRRMQYPRVHVLAGGLAQWQAEGGAIEHGRVRPAPLLFDEARRLTRTIAPAALQELLAGGAPVTVLDVDTSRYHAARHVPGAHWIPYGSLESRVADFVSDRAATVVVCCHDGLHSTYAGANLARMGYADVRVLDGGTDRWAKAGLPCATGLGEATPDDIVVPPYNSDKAAMAKYLEWEKKLTGDRRAG
ncbi:MAG: hypothetical protein IPO58_08475 [Betaproteobacteria bacterium]|nr:hypothetical protein [Betaproteobacteria bacterium]